MRTEVLLLNPLAPISGPIVLMSRNGICYADHRVSRALLFSNKRVMELPTVFKAYITSSLRALLTRNIGALS